VLSAASEVGGFKEVVFFFIITFYSFYNDYRMTSFIREEIFPEKNVMRFLKSREYDHDVTQPKPKKGIRHDGLKVESAGRTVERVDDSSYSKHNLLTESKREVYSPGKTDYSELDNEPSPRSPHKQSPFLKASSRNKPDQPTHHGHPVSLPRLDSTPPPQPDPIFPNLTVPHLSTPRKPHPDPIVPSTLTAQIECMRESVCSLFSTLSSVECLVAELGSWKVFKEIVFQDYHFRLMSLVQIEVERKKKERAKKMESGREGKLDPFGDETITELVTSFIADTIDINGAIDKLKTRACDKLDLLSIDLMDLRRQRTTGSTRSPDKYNDTEDEFAKLRERFTQLSLNGTLQDRIDYFFIHNLPKIFQNSNISQHRTESLDPERHSP